MRILLATIFLLALTGPAIVQEWREHDRVVPVCGGEPLRPNESCVIGTWVLINTDNEIRRAKIHEYPECPWWVDPEIWWSQNCDGGLPPRLPVPEGLR